MMAEIGASLCRARRRDAADRVPESVIDPESPNKSMPPPLTLKRRQSGKKHFAKESSQSERDAGPDGWRRDAPPRALMRDSQSCPAAKIPREAVRAHSAPAGKYANRPSR